MNLGYLDIPAEAADAFREAEAKKKGVCCQRLHGRFDIRENGRVVFSGLICKGLGGHNTGTSAPYCQNCKLEGRDPL